MQVDFYQLTRDPAEKVLPPIAQRVLDGGGRLLVQRFGDGTAAKPLPDSADNPEASELAPIAHFDFIAQICTRLTNPAD